MFQNCLPSSVVSGSGDRSSGRRGRSGFCWICASAGEPIASSKAMANPLRRQRARPAVTVIGIPDLPSS
jgi:hypothetical protein